MYSLRWYQSAACDAVWADLCARPGNPVVVLPTGAGKSLVIAELCRKAIQDFDGRVLVLAHRKELLIQNADKIAALLPPMVRVGVHSAGLRSRDVESPVIVGQIQSIYQHAEKLGRRHLVIVDESHLVAVRDEGRYRRFFSDLQAINPQLRIVGLTATPFRTDEGDLCSADGVFQRICFEAPIGRLMEEGFLSRVVNSISTTKVDVDAIRVRAGEFVAGEMENAFLAEVGAACAELARKIEGRSSVLVFCAGVRHANEVARVLRGLMNERIECVTGETSPLERGQALSDFRAKRLRILCNVDVLTTGFDAPNIDCVAVLRATMSAGLFAQIVGRGFRRAEGKDDCLVLDFGGNIERHGPLDHPEYGKRPKKGEGDAPTKSCPNCNESVPISAIVCESCGFAFPPPSLKPRHGTGADESSEILLANAKPEWFSVVRTTAQRHRKRNSDGTKPDTLRIDYFVETVRDPCECGATRTTTREGKGPHGAALHCAECDAFLKWVKRGNLDDLESIGEWVCIEHSGFAGDKAARWWKARCHTPVESIDEAVRMWELGYVATAARIRAVRDGKFWKIVEHDLDEIPEGWAPSTEDAFDMEDLPF